MKGMTKKDMFQYAAFKAFYKAARLGGLDRINAFVSGIVKSSNDEADKLSPAVIDAWWDEYGLNNKRKPDHIIL